jgi:hypothetical protein
MDYHQVVTTGGEKRVQGDVVKMSFVDANASQTSGQKPLAGSISYFTGKDLAHCQTKVPHFAEAVSGNVYKGVDTRYYLDRGTPRYDLIVNPGADPSKVALKFEGAEDVRVLPNGNLAIKTSIGQMEQSGLQAYQQIGPTRVPISCQMAASGGVVRFNIGSYDHANALVIDPIIKAQATPNIHMSQLVFGGYENGPEYDPKGGGANAILWDMCLDPDGDPTFTGRTSDEAFPVSPGAYDRSFQTYIGVVGFVVKINSTGDGLIYATYLGATDPSFDSPQTECLAITCDAAGNALIGGVTNSVPITPGAFQPTIHEPSVIRNDGLPYQTTTAFVSKLSADGSTLMASTYLGGSGVNPAIKSTGTGEQVSSLAVDLHGDVIISGDTYSYDFPVTAGAIQTHHKGYANGFGTDFIARMDPLFQKVKASTFLGGTGAVEYGDAAVNVDSDNNILFTGYTLSTDFPITSNAYQKYNAALVNQYGKEGGSGIFARISPDCKSLLYCSYYGDTLYGALAPVREMPGGNLLLIGRMNVPLTPGTYATGLNNGYGAFFAVFSHDGSKLIRAAYLDSIDLNYYDFDLNGNIVFSGDGDAALPMTPDALYPAESGVRGENSSGILEVINPQFTGILYGTWFGPDSGFGTGSGIGQVHVTSSGKIAFAGGGNSTALPVTLDILYPGARQIYIGEFFLADFATMQVQPPSVVAGNTATGRLTLNFPAIQPGVKIDLQSDNPAVTVPPSIDFLVGQVQTTFTIYTSDLATSPIAHITASYGGAKTCKGSLALTFPALAFEVNSTQSVSKSTVTGQVKIATPAVGSAVLVSVSSDNPSVVVPKTVPIYPGSVSAYFPISAGSITQAQTATVTAKMGTLTRSVFLTLDPMVNTFSLAPASVTGGTAALGTVSLSGRAGVSGLVVNLSSSNANAVVPATVNIPAQQSYVTFPVTTKGVNAATAVTITAKLANLTKTSTLTVLPAALLRVTPSVTFITGGSPVNALIKLSGNVGTVPVVVALTSSNTAAVVPATATVAAGSSSQVFRITTKPVKSATTVTITAKVGGVTQTATLTLNPPGA